jgi:CIC family chloride channel protein
MEGIGGYAHALSLAGGPLFASGFSVEALLNPHRWIMAVLPAAGAVLGYLLIKRFSSVEHARGTDSAIRAYHHRDGYITGAVIPVKSAASVLTVASGGSAGYEGPVTLLGAAVGSVVSRRLNLTVRARRILMTAGLSAGIAALFQAPLAGAIFGFEIIDEMDVVTDMQQYARERWQQRQKKYRVISQKENRLETDSENFESAESQA